MKPLIKKVIKKTEKYFATNHLYLAALSLISFVVFYTGLKIKYFRYANFEFGKFDLGNMTQMVWNTLNGKFMYLTD